MLRQAHNVSLWWESRDGTATGSGAAIFRVGRKGYHHLANMTRAEWDAWAAQPEDEPVRLAKVGALGYWRYQGRWYVEDENLTGADLRSLIVTQDQLRKARLNRARTIAAMAESPAPIPVRGAIPDDLRLLVWTRDQGRCRRCGSTSELQLDHIIPWSRGGATTAENLEVLCGPCNRQKGASVASPSRASPSALPSSPP
ncbi:hypothetical protein GHK86_08205 [Acidimicrobiaceae bacterium USS-CC1]|uniref:HNH nuclease domain-containing protein n=1 Tax=Acidiferrimicrobium australe TaxID=2664430 RepID=A0ABW9QS86_9ACTN|nr:hypothetical protein [Acidiferrimicrobium australe]